MTVSVTNMQTHGGSQFAYFADDFNRVDQPFYIGNNWCCSFYSADTQTTASLAQSEFNVAANKLVISQVGGGNTPKSIAYPMRFNGQYCWGKSQFSEVLVSAINTGFNTTRWGPAVLSRQNDASAYWMEFDNAGVNTTYAIQRWVNNVPVVIINSRTYVVGETMRIEAVVSASNVIINAYRNGVLDATATDSSAGRLGNGIPCLFGFGLNGNTDSITFTNFKCGTLPQLRTDANYP